jgi:hypothetical protein
MIQQPDGERFSQLYFEMVSSAFLYPTAPSLRMVSRGCITYKSPFSLGVNATFNSIILE